MTTQVCRKEIQSSDLSDESEYIRVNIVGGKGKGSVASRGMLRDRYRG